MSARDPSGRLIGKPKLAQALAALKHGLKDDADPLYDTWKRPSPIAGDAVSGVIAHREELAQGAEPKTGAPSSSAAMTTETEGPRGEDEPAASPPVSVRAPRPSFGDTIRVRVIPYRVFPMWVWYMVAGAVLFVISAVLIRWLAPSDTPRAVAPGPPVEVLESAQVAPLDDSTAGEQRRAEPAEAPPAAAPPRSAPVPSGGDRKRGAGKAPRATGFVREPGF